MARRSTLRASDADRERVAERLRQAALEGRLLAHEFEERLARAFRALTYGELDALVADLPGGAFGGGASRRNGSGRRRGGVTLEPRRSMVLELARRHPAAIAVLAAIVGLSVAAVVLTAVAILASGVWILPLVVFLVIRHRAGGPRNRRRRYDGGGWNSLRGL